MKIISQDKIGNPIVNPSGEMVFEIFGKDETLGETTNHGFARVRIPVGKSSEKHFHKKMEETYYILSGNGRIVINGQTYILNPGDSCLIMPEEIHQIFNDSSTDDLIFLVVSAPTWDITDQYLVD